MTGEVRYCTTEDGVRIAVSVEGDGPVLVQCSAAWESLSGENPWQAAYDPVQRGRRLVQYDPRGVGLSDRDPKSFTHDAMVSDLKTVIQATGIQQFAMFATHFSVAWAIDYAANHPDRVERLILTRGAVTSRDTMTRDNIHSLIGLINSNWEMASQLLGDAGIREQSQDFGERAASDVRRNITPSAAAQWLLDIYDSTDVSALLPRVQAPTLVLHRTADTLFPFSGAQEMAVRIPRARLIALSGSGSIALGDDTPTTMQTIVRFLDEGRAQESQPSHAVEPYGTFRTVLFTDLVGHTEMMRRLGDDRGRDVLREHERITRETLKQHGGAEVKTMGDGFMASFGSVTKAMDCAIALQRAFATYTESMPEPLHVRVGLNAGEPIEEDGDLFGSTVILASRIAAKAGAGEILIAEPLRHLLSGKSYVYADRGETMLKGFEDAVRLYEVRWRE